MTVEDWPELAFKPGDLPVSVFAKGVEATGLRVFLIAQCALPSRPTANNKLELQPPLEARRSLEQRLETTVNAIAVATRTRRTICSIEPCLGFVADSQEESGWLQGHAGIERQVFSCGYARPQIPLSVLEEIGSDRDDGIALMAEAMAHTHASGRFHEFFRLFERAFKTACNQLETPLSTFLSGQPSGFTADEVRQWIEIRGPLTHADRRPEFLLERDTFQVVRRMEQAAVDVLVNKANWRDPSPLRKTRWREPFGSSAPLNDLFVVQGMAPQLAFEALDQFGSYPVMFGTRLTQAPVEWWFGNLVPKGSAGINRGSGNFTIISADPK